MIRVLHIFHEMANGGVEHFVMNYYRHMDREKIQFDFLVSVETEGYFDDEIKALGGRMFYAYPFKKNPIRNYYDIAKIVRENKYNIVHRHTGSAFGYFDLRAARRGGAKHLIIHSHNNQAGNMFVHKICKNFLEIPCEKLACSQDAGLWLYGEHASFKVINNAIECEKFCFNRETRERMRANFNLYEKFVIGHVGRFSEQKNHKRLFELLADIVKIQTNAVLVCVGTGELLDWCKGYVEKLKIEKNVIFLGKRTDINNIMCAFDVFVLPSAYEGFPFVLVEAQASGLHCVVSECVPKECNITGNVEFLSLKDNNRSWYDQILYVRTSEREQCAEQVRKAGFNINSNAQELYNYYEKLTEV